MTLAELIVAIAILGIVFATIAAAMVMGLRQTSASETELIEQNGAMLTARYFVPDVQGARRFDDPGDACGADGVLTLGTVLADGTRVVTYRVEQPEVDGAWALVRRQCDGGAQVSEIVLAEHLDPPSTPDDANDPATAPVVVTCSGLGGSPCRIDVTQAGNPSSRPAVDPLDFSLEAVPRGSP